MHPVSLKISEILIWVTSPLNNLSPLGMKEGKVHKQLRLQGTPYGTVFASIKTQLDNGAPRESDLCVDLPPNDVAQAILRELANGQSNLVLCDDLVVKCSGDFWQSADSCIDVLLAILRPISEVRPLLLNLSEFSRVKFKDYVRLFQLVNDIKDGLSVKLKIPRIPDGRKPRDQEDRAVIGSNFVEVEVWRLGEGFNFDAWFAVLEETTFRSLKLHYIKHSCKSGKDPDFIRQAHKRDMAKILKPFLPFANNVSRLEEFSLCWADLAINNTDERTWRESRWSMPNVKKLYLKDVSVWNDGHVTSPIIDIGAEEIETNTVTSRNFLQLFTFPNLHTLKVVKYREEDPAVLSRLMETIMTLKITRTRWPTLRPLFSHVLPKTKIENLEFSGVDFVEKFADPLKQLKYLRALRAEFNAQPNGRPHGPNTDGTVGENEQEEYIRGYNRNVTCAAKRPGFNRRCNQFVKSLLHQLDQLSIFKFEAGHIYRKTASTRDEVIVLQR